MHKRTISSSDLQQGLKKPDTVDAMKQKMNKSACNEKLRLEAEHALHDKRDTSGKRPNVLNEAMLERDSDAYKQLHELQVTQIELSMQNSQLQELQQTRMEKEQLLERYTDLYEFAPIGYFTLDRDGTIHEVNLTGTSLIGLVRSKLIGRRFGVFVAIESQPAFRAFLARVFDSGVMQSCEVRLLNTERQPFFAHIKANADATVQTCRLMVVDISARKSTEQALKNHQEELESRVLQRTAALLHANARLATEVGERKRTEEMLRHTQHILQQAQRVAHVGSWERDITNGAVRWSDEFFRICGYSAQAFIPSMTKVLKFIHPEDRNAVYRAIQRSIEHCHGFIRTVRIVRPNGTIRYVRLQGDVNCNNGKPQTLVGAVLDITEFKNAEVALLQSQETIRSLAAHQESVKESERKRIAREIHDELGQNLLALRIDVSMLAARTIGKQSRLHTRAQAALDQIDTTIAAVRGIINNLRPAVLDLGLPAAIEWQVQQFKNRSNIACNLHIAGTDTDYQLDDNRATAVFRILQESLTNISRHAQAGQIKINLHKEGDKIHMTVADDGIGISQNCRRKTKSYGLIGIQERVKTLHGELIIDSDKSHGTTLTVIIPTGCSEDNDESEMPF